MTRCTNCMEEIEEGQDICPHCEWDNSTTPTQDRNLAAGTLLNNRYLIGKVLGAGGFGITYIAYDEQLERKVAIKEYFPSDFATRRAGSTELSIFSGESTTLFNKVKESFIDEGRKLAAFAGQGNIVAVYDSFEANNTAYIVMELLQGATLKDFLVLHGCLSFDEALTLITPVLDALSTVHSAGIIHRDVAPDNIFIRNDGSVALIDFGAARAYSGDASKSMTVMLKPGYAPVEQYRSKGKQGPWTDVYATAATFYRMITGQTPEESMQRAFEDGLQPPSALGVGISPESEAALMAALAVEPKNRIQNAEQFKAGLMGHSFTVLPTAARSTSFTPLDATNTEHKRTKKRLHVAIAAVAILVVVGIGAFFAFDASNQTSSVEAPVIQTEASDQNTNEANTGEAVSTETGIPEIGEIIEFGTFDGQPIEWRVLAVEDEKALVISKYILGEERWYSDESNSWSDKDPTYFFTMADNATWENSGLRSYLNNEFYDDSFTVEERKSIIPVTNYSGRAEGKYDSEQEDFVITIDNAPDADTEDNIFLLSYEESEKYFSGAKDRTTTSIGGEDSTQWWLRTPYGINGFAIISNGSLFEAQNSSVGMPAGVRPALWLDLETYSS